MADLSQEAYVDWKAAESQTGVVTAMVWQVEAHDERRGRAFLGLWETAAGARAAVGRPLGDTAEAHWGGVYDAEGALVEVHCLTEGCCFHLRRLPVWAAREVPAWAAAFVVPCRHGPDVNGVPEAEEEAPDADR